MPGEIRVITFGAKFVKKKISQKLRDRNKLIAQKSGKNFFHKINGCAITNDLKIAEFCTPKLR